MRGLILLTLWISDQITLQFSNCLCRWKDGKSTLKEHENHPAEEANERKKASHNGNKGRPGDAFGTGFTRDRGAWMNSS